jgi:hypothetical protein
MKRGEKYQGLQEYLILSHGFFFTAKDVMGFYEY